MPPARMVDILLSPEELAALGKKGTSCMHLPQDMLAPAVCVSKAGVSSAAMFGKGHGSHQSQELSVADYAKLYNKYYGDGSVIEKLLASQSRPSDPVTDRDVDTQMHKRALHETRAKYLSPRLAGMYQVDAPGIVGPPPSAPPVLGLTLVPRRQPNTENTGAAAQQAPGSMKVLEMASHVIQSQSAKEAAAEMQAAKKAAEKRRQIQAAYRAASTPQETSSFRSATRDQRSRTGSRFVDPGDDSPGPCKYDVRWRYWEHKTCMDMCPPSYSAQQRQLLASKKAKAMAADQLKSRPSTALSKRASAAGSQAAATAAAGSRRPSSAGYGDQRDGHSLSRRMSECETRTNNASFSHGRSESGVSRGRAQHRPVSAPAMRPGTAKGPQQQQHVNARQAALDMFKDAHQVHGWAKPRPGSSSFKAPTRPMLNAETAAGHLALKYHKDDIDLCARKARHLIMPFQAQPPRKPLLTGADTPEALGPGAYPTPVTYSGRHVTAGHVGVRHTPDFARAGPRPHSAHLAGSEPIAPVSQQEASTALHSLFHEGMNPSDLISVEQLHALSGVSKHYQDPATVRRRPHSAAVHAPSPGQVGAGNVWRPGSARPVSAPRAAQVAQAVTATTALSERPAPGAPQAHHSADGPRALGPYDLERYSSTGLSGRVKGGHFARTTRAQEIQGLRVVADGKVIPPASAPLTKIRPSQAADTIYDPVSDTVQGHRPRTPAWQLPPNRAALSKQWVSAAALAYI